MVEGNLEAKSAGHARGDGLQSVFAKKVTIEGFEDVKCSLVFGESIWGGGEPRRRKVSPSVLPRPARAGQVRRRGRDAYACNTH